MIKPQVHLSQHTTQNLLFLQRPFVHGVCGNGTASLPLWPESSISVQRQKVKRFDLTPRYVQATLTSATDTEKSTVKLKVVVKAKIAAGFFSSLRLDRGIDETTDLLGKSLLLELVSSELDPKTGLKKETIRAYAHKAGQGEESVKYETDLEIPNDFGDIGAVLVENEHHKEMFLETILLRGFPEGPIRVDCASWVHSKFDNPTKRVFFTNKVWHLIKTQLRNTNPTLFKFIYDLKY